SYDLPGRKIVQFSVADLNRNPDAWPWFSFFRQRKSESSMTCHNTHACPFEFILKFMFVAGT
ncbi:MAG: cytochrome P450, partial [Cyanobacteria bacterium]|nr:cytochrome P450 [Cyanobacteriota bacterium]